jgi:uncharacterized protein (TIGR02001 family)
MRLLARSALLLTLAPAWAAAPSRAAEPEWTVAVTAASDYYFRGVSQTLNEPALQADLAVEHASGWFGSLFASTVSFPEDPYEDLGTYELAARVGYGHALGRGWTAVGSAARYAYPNAQQDHDYFELGVGLNYRGVAASFGWAEDALGYAGPGRIWELVGTRSLPWRLGLSAGVGVYELPDLDDGYAFWHVALTRPLGRFAADLGYYGSDGDGRRLYGERADPRVVVGLSYRVH